MDRISLFSASLLETKVRPSRSPLLWLLVTYALLRILFYQWPQIKAAFIYPTGLLVNLMGFAGEYAFDEWSYRFQTVRFTLGELCSGTTFFCLVMAFLVYQWRSQRVSPIWFVVAYPLTIVANAIRVGSSMILYLLLDSMQLSYLNEPFHLACGVVTFLTALLALAYLIETGRRRHG